MDLVLFGDYLATLKYKSKRMDEIESHMMNGCDNLSKMNEFNSPYDLSWKYCKVQLVRISLPYSANLKEDQRQSELSYEGETIEN